MVKLLMRFALQRMIQWLLPHVPKIELLGLFSQSKKFLLMILSLWNIRSSDCLAIFGGANGHLDEVISLVRFLQNFKIMRKSLGYGPKARVFGYCKHGSHSSNLGFASHFWCGKTNCWMLQQSPYWLQTGNWIAISISGFTWCTHKLCGLLPFHWQFHSFKGIQLKGKFKMKLKLPTFRLVKTRLICGNLEVMIYALPEKGLLIELKLMFYTLPKWICLKQRLGSSNLTCILKIRLFFI